MHLNYYSYARVNISSGGETEKRRGGDAALCCEQGARAAQQRKHGTVRSPKHQGCKNTATAGALARVFKSYKVWFLVRWNSGVPESGQCLYTLNF